MKELTIEQKAKAYDKALERAKEFYILCKKCGAKDTVDFLEDNFPELCEPDDEKIRKTLLRWIQSNSYTNIAGMPIKNIIDWLEKQGEQKPIINVPTREVIISIWDLGNEWKELTNGSISTEYGTQLDYIQKHWHESEYYLREKQGEQKVPVIDFKAKDWYVSKVDGKIRNIYHSVDKVEPKFKVGDWIIDDKNRVGIIVRILDEHYIISFDGREVQISFEWEGKLFRKWSIKDAKDGDVLKEDSCTFIIERMKPDGTAIIHCCLFDDGDFDLDSTLGFDVDSTYPATKEQRDLLFQKMNEAGYEWDAEKKELKKIEQSKLTEFEDAVKDMMDDYRDAIDANDATTEEVKERAAYMLSLIPHKPADWSEEDERNLNCIMKIIKEKAFADYDVDENNNMLGIYGMLESWLKLLKQRYAWKPSDEQMECLLSEVTAWTKGCPKQKVLESLYNDLKKLKA